MGFFEKMNTHASLMGRMMETVGALDHIPNTLQADIQLRKAATRCLGCSQPGECSTWLSEHEGGADRAPGYCPNADLFEEWKAGS